MWDRGGQLRHCARPLFHAVLFCILFSCALGFKLKSLSPRFILGEGDEIDAHSDSQLPELVPIVDQAQPAEGTVSPSPSPSPCVHGVMHWGLLNKYSENVSGASRVGNLLLFAKFRCTAIIVQAIPWPKPDNSVGYLEDRRFCPSDVTWGEIMTKNERSVQEEIALMRKQRTQQAEERRIIDRELDVPVDTISVTYNNAYYGLAREVIAFYLNTLTGAPTTESIYVTWQSGKHNVIES